MGNAFVSWLEALCWSLSVFWNSLCYPFHWLRSKAVIDYDDLDTGDWKYVASEEELATYAAMEKEMLSK